MADTDTDIAIATDKGLNSPIHPTSPKPTRETRHDVDGPTIIHECRMQADAHMGLGRNVHGHGPNPYEPHAHPFSLVLGLVACCTGNADCRIEGHITLTDDGYHHAIGATR